jgi:hypothetical protein
MERFTLKKLNEVEGKEQYHVEVSNRFTALEDLGTEVNINSAWETIKENINIRSISHGLTKDAQNSWIKRNKPVAVDSASKRNT